MKTIAHRKHNSFYFDLFRFSTRRSLFIITQQEERKKKDNGKNVVFPTTCAARKDGGAVCPVLWSQQSHCQPCTPHFKRWATILLLLTIVHTQHHHHPLRRRHIYIYSTLFSENKQTLSHFLIYIYMYNLIYLSIPFVLLFLIYKSYKLKSRRRRRTRNSTVVSDPVSP